LVPDARHMAMAPQGTALFVGTKKEKVWVGMVKMICKAAMVTIV
jgi:hypothetical protein